LVHPSGNSTIRVLLRKPGLESQVRNRLEQFGCMSEVMADMSLLAVVMPNEANITDALEFLDTEEQLGNIGIEESAVRYV
jgi:hypothetical protein